MLVNGLNVRRRQRSLRGCNCISVPVDRLTLMTQTPPALVIICRGRQRRALPSGAVGFPPTPAFDDCGDGARVAASGLGVPREFELSSG